MDLTYRIVRSERRRKLSIIVERDRSIVVHAPATATDDSIRQVVDSKRQWLFEKIHHTQKYQDRPHPPGKELVNGESAPYLGRDYRIEITDTASGGVEFSRRFLIPRAMGKLGREALKQWYLEQAEKAILPRVCRHAAELGVAVAGVSIVDNRYRWGSCTVKDQVHFNWRLVKAPMFVIDYVIVHELAHLMEANHTPRFWNIVRAKVPTCDKAKAWLKEHGQLLENEI
jgi:predicted metal-dependent hydrolase